MRRLMERKEGQQKRTYKADCVQDVSACNALEETLLFIAWGDRDRDIAPGNAVGNLQIGCNHAIHNGKLVGAETHGDVQGTRVTDVVDYAWPIAPASSVMDALGGRLQIRQLFHSRQRKLLRLLRKEAATPS
jgi:hypothetical protein